MLHRGVTYTGDPVKELKTDIAFKEPLEELLVFLPLNKKF
jgi:hypothetical protein